MKFEMCWYFTALEYKTRKKICLLINKTPFSFLSMSKKIINIFESSSITACFKIIEFSLLPELFNFKLNIYIWNESVTTIFGLLQHSMQKWEKQLCFNSCPNEYLIFQITQLPVEKTFQFLHKQQPGSYGVFSSLKWSLKHSLSNF